MRFDQNVWLGMPAVERMGYTMTCILDRARRFSDTLCAANIPFAVCGGLSVMAWVETRDPGCARSTKDVDVLMRRADLQRAADALAPHGFIYVEVNGIPMFLDGPDGTPKHAIHIVIAGESDSKWATEPVPDIGPGVRDPAFPWARSKLGLLLTMKLITNRTHDRVHIADLWRAKAIDRSWIAQVPESLRDRLSEWIDTAEREYGDSPH